jgi:GT2 family glycosyltransferase
MKMMVEAIAGPSPEDPDIVAVFAAGAEGLDSPERLPAAGGPVSHGCSVVLCTFARPESLRRLLRSLAAQERRPDELVIVDASPDDRTERVVREELGFSGSAPRTLYHRVTGKHRGLTRQRNFALARVTFDLVAFFDDDAVLEPACLAELERALRERADEVVGAGGYVEGETPGADRLWRVRRALGIVGDLTPGRYCRSGMSIPWTFLPAKPGIVEGDWLPGYAMMWRTQAAREVRFHDGFAGYGQGEDLDFSLRMRRFGSLVLVGSARLRHLHEPAGRSDAFRLGYMAIRNRWHIHRRGLSDRSWRDSVWFVYAWTLDSLMLCRNLLFLKRWAPTFRHLAGRLVAVADLCLGR